MSRDLPDARDGLTRTERVVLVALRQALAERKGRAVRAAMLYGRVCEHVDIGFDEFMRIVERLSSLGAPLLERSAHAPTANSNRASRSADEDFARPLRHASTVSRT